jgi:hypothetical protein
VVSPGGAAGLEAEALSEIRLLRENVIQLDQPEGL